MNLDYEISLDLRRYRKLKALLSSADFGYWPDEHPGCVALIFRLPVGSKVSANLDATLDALPDRCAEGGQRNAD